MCVTCVGDTPHVPNTMKACPTPLYAAAAFCSWKWQAVKMLAPAKVATLKPSCWLMAFWIYVYVYVWERSVQSRFMCVCIPFSSLNPAACIETTASMYIKKTRKNRVPRSLCR